MCQPAGPEGMGQRIPNPPRLVGDALGWFGVDAASRPRRRSRTPTVDTVATMPLRLRRAFTQKLCWNSGLSCSLLPVAEHHVAKQLIHA